MAFDPKKKGTTLGAGITSLSICVHGPTKCGKTTLAGTTGDDSKVIMLAAEHGLLPLREKDIRVYEMDSGETLLGAMEWLEGLGRAGKLAGWTVFLDSASDIADRILRAAKTTPVKGKVPDPRQAYGEVQDVMMDVMRRFRSLPCTTVMICQQGKVEQPDGSIVFSAQLPGATLSAKAGYQFELVLAMHVKTGADGVPTHWLQTRPDGRYDAGDRSGVLSPSEPPSLEVIVKKIMGSVKVVDAKLVEPEPSVVVIPSTFIQDRAPPENFAPMMRPEEPAQSPDIAKALAAFARDFPALLDEAKAVAETHGIATLRRMYKEAQSPTVVSADARGDAIAREYDRAGSGGFTGD